MTNQKIIERLCRLNMRTSQWIPCSERKPDENDKYLVTYDNKNRGVSTAYYQDWCDGWYKGSGKGYLKTDIAWMPFPEPYEGES